MTLLAGSRLGSYEVVAPIGAGGMGEVYRARDARLGREVAIKVLPAAMASDPDRRARFEQEARSASALNHPNILTIYDIGEADGTIYIAMEVVEGRTLRELVAAEALPTRKLLDVAVQTAEGLAKAHDAGIVHRDLKPENIMVSKDGFVKILDFGLAKLTEPASQQPQSVLPTAVAAPTEPGTVMGTVGYMSPEQASGQPVDYRSDQFTLGSILYEMAAGQKAFQRKTGAETLVAIIREEPQALSQAAPASPAPVRWIVERCLAKDPEERYASTKDLARELRSLRDHLSESSTSARVDAAERVPPRRKKWAPVLGILLAGIALGVLLRGVLPQKPDSPIRVLKLTFKRGTVFSARFSPDGQSIFYGAAWDGGPLEIYSERTDSRESHSAGLPPSDILSVSSAGEAAISLGRHFTTGFETTGTLARVPLGGTAPREMLENVVDADWSPDGKQLAVARSVGGRAQVEYPIGKVLYTPRNWVSNVRVSPDGALVAFLDHPQSGDNQGVVKVVDRDGRVRLTGPVDQLSLAWSPRGDEVWSCQPVQATSLSGKTRVLWTASGLDRLADVGRDGRLLFLRAQSRREIVGISPQGDPRNLTWLNWSYPVDLSSDGQVELFDESDVEPDTNLIYVRRLDGSAPVLIGRGKGLSVSADGRWALTTPKQGSGQLTLLPIGAGEPLRIPDSNLSIQWGSFLPDGKSIVVTGIEPGHGARLYALELPNGKPRPISPEGIQAAPGHPIAPDGSRIAARGSDGSLMLYPIGGGEPAPLRGAEADDTAVRWTRDGRQVYVFRPALPGRVDLIDVQTGARTPWKQGIPPDPAGISQIEPWVIAADGRTCVYSYRRLLDELQLVTGIR